MRLTALGYTGAYVRRLPGKLIYVVYCRTDYFCVLIPQGRTVVPLAIHTPKGFLGLTTGCANAGLVAGIRKNYFILVRNTILLVSKGAIVQNKVEEWQGEVVQQPQ